MPVEWTVSHAQRMVLAVAKGKIEAADIERYLHAVSKDCAMSYAKIFNLSESTSLPAASSVRALGGIVSRYAQDGPVGPVAIVAPSDESFRRAQIFARAASAKRPLKIFRELHEASRWIKSLEQAKLDASDPP